MNEERDISNELDPAGDAENTRALVVERVQTLSEVLNSHAGGIDVIDVEGGTVTLAFTGMCAGCPLRTVTMAGLIRPALEDIEGVSSVQAQGTRISREAEERMQRLIRDSGGARLLCLVTEQESPQGSDKTDG